MNYMLERIKTAMLDAFTIFGLNGPLKALTNDLFLILLTSSLPRRSWDPSEVKSILTKEDFTRFIVKLPQHEKEKMRDYFFNEDFLISDFKEQVKSIVNSIIEMEDSRELQAEMYEYCTLVFTTPNVLFAFAADLSELRPLVILNAVSGGKISASQKAVDTSIYTASLNKSLEVVNAASRSKQLIHLRMVKDPKTGKYVIQALPSSAGVWDVLWHISQARNWAADKERDDIIQNLSDNILKLARKVRKTK